MTDRKKQNARKLFILTGPTAVGKTELALRWAESFDAEIVSSDSLLFYRGMDIGTAKPSVEERKRVRHHLIDVAEPDEPWSIHHYLEESVRIVDEILARNKNVLVTGGSGFYLKSFLAPVVDPVEISEEIKNRVRRLEKKGLETMVRELLRIDCSAGESLDLQNPRRVIRALERCLATGKSIRELRKEMEERSFPFEDFEAHVCVLTRDREELQERIAQRVDQMLDSGLVEEVRKLLDRGILKNRSAASAIGYRESIRFLSGELSDEDLRDEIIRNTNRLVKKQRTWFRHQLAGARELNLSGRGEIDLAEIFD